MLFIADNLDGNNPNIILFTCGIEYNINMVDTIHITFNSFIIFSVLDKTILLLTSI